METKAHHRAQDPQTSVDAAARVSSSDLQSRVLVWLERIGPATAHELARALGVDLVSVSPRLKPLEGLGLVERVGRRDRRTVWAVKARAATPA